MATSCAAGVSEDGTTRCLPLGAREVAAVIFTDAACTKPYAFERADVTNACGGVSAVSLAMVRNGVHDPSCAGTSTIVRQRFLRVAPPTQVTFQTGTPLYYGGTLSYAGCNRADVPPFCTAGVACSVRLVTAIAPSEFVAIAVGETHD